MTIAACYLSPEGVVLGADSTSTYTAPSGNHYYNHAQKLFEIGDGSTLGVVTWGLGGLELKSYRRLFAVFADDLAATPAKSVHEIAERWIDRFWAEYDAASLVHLCRDLEARPPFGAPASGQADSPRSKEEEDLLENLKQGLGVGFCIGGYVLNDRTPAAFSVWFDPLSSRPPLSPAAPGFNFWGAPNMIKRLIFGWDDQLRASLVASGQWRGTADELDDILAQQQLAHPSHIPIRDAVDFVHTCILSTIKAFKFSNFSQICGGPIEVAVITTDRPFRWVRHKDWDSAISEGAA